VQSAIFSPTPEQRQAIEHVHGPMLVVAAAGTGKTTVLARRIASARAPSRSSIRSSILSSMPCSLE